jgi:hypothetical protein
LVQVRARLHAVVALVAVTAVLGACSGGGGSSASAQQKSTTTAPTTTAPTTAPPAVVTPLGPQTPPVCLVDDAPSGPLLQYPEQPLDAALNRDPAFVAAGGKPRPPGFTPQSQIPFDWNRDGNGDRLVVSNAEGTTAGQQVSIDFGNGAFVITGVVTNVPDEGRLQTALVADVTGDGIPDLIVEARGIVVVVTGGGPFTTAQTVTFDQLAQAVRAQHLGWVSPRVAVPGPRTADGKQATTFEPVEGALDLTALWDFTGDGIPDFQATQPTIRVKGVTYYYAGKPCLH